MHNWDAGNPMRERDGVADDDPAEQDTRPAPGLSGGEFPGAEEEADAMADSLTAKGQDTTFGGAVGEPGPTGTMGTVDQTNAAAVLDEDQQNEQEAY